MATQPGAIVPFNPAALPAHIAQFTAGQESNIEARSTVPSLSPEGKTWTIAIGGSKQKLQARNADGDVVPMPIMKFIVLDYAKQRGRSYYEGEYDPAKVAPPVCWSEDGVTPHASLPGPFPAGTTVEAGKPRKISAACANCPMSVKGSKIIPGTDKQITACAQHRMLAVLPDPALRLPEALQKPLRLKIAMTSDWDKQSPDQEQQGWLAFSNYMDWLLNRNVKHSTILVTKAKFDVDAAYPKIFFSAERYLDADEMAIVTPLANSDEVKKLLSGNWTPAGVDGVPIADQTVGAQQAVAAGVAPASPAPAAEVAPVIASAAPPPAQPPASLADKAAGATYVMADGEAHTREQYLEGGWTDEQLIEHGKMKLVEPVTATAPPPPAATPAPVEQVQEQPAVIVTEAAQPEPVAAPAPVVTETIVVTEPVAAAAPAEPSSAAVVAEVAPPVQAPAQAAAPEAVVVAQPDPPAAAAKAAEVAPQVATEVPSDVEALLAQWGPDAVVAG